jgi:hypothetical protein
MASANLEAGVGGIVIIRRYHLDEFLTAETETMTGPDACASITTFPKVSVRSEKQRYPQKRKIARALACASENSLPVMPRLMRWNMDRHQRK